MFLILRRKQLFIVTGLVVFIVMILTQAIYELCFSSGGKMALSESEALTLISSIFHLRNQALLENNLPALTSLYDRTGRNGVWAYEHQSKKMKYIHSWCYKQGIQFSAIKSLIRVRRVQSWCSGIRMTLLVSTEYHYYYCNEPKVNNLMRIGTYHSLDLTNKEDEWLICREWYTDPFSDALEMEKDQAILYQSFILSQKSRNFSNLTSSRIKALAYADEYIGAAADEERGFKYNLKYKNYNYSGGDCANYASQVLHEGGGLRKTAVWNYGKDGSKAWTNAQAFNRYMLWSGYASRIAYGTYTQVLKNSYELLPGDYIAYEKKGKVTHISIITGADSKGYRLTNSHNADRYRVPWDLGYGGHGIRFWLVRVHY